MADEQGSNIAEMRQLMLEQLRALRTAPPGESLAQELKRSKGVSELSATIIDSARVEVEYLRVKEGDGEVPFLAPPEGNDRLGLTPANAAHAPFGASVVHRLKG